MHRRVIASLLALPLLMAAAVWLADIRTDISAFFVAGDSPQAALVASNMQTGEISRRYLLSIGWQEAHRTAAAGGSAEIPADFLAALRDRLAAIKGVERVWGSGRDEAELRKLINFYLPWRYALHALQPATAVPPLFSATALEKRAATVKQALLSPEGAWVKSIVAKDPMLLTLDWLRHLPGNGEQPAGDYAALVVQTAVAGLDTAGQAPIRQQIEAAFGQLNDDSGHRFTLDMTGVPLFAMAAQQQVASDIGRVSTLSMLSMLLFFLLMFRSLWALVAVMLTLLAAATVATIATSLAFGEIHALTLALGTTLIGVCVDYPIHTMVHAAGSGRRATESTRVIWPSLLLGAVTTMVGYAALSLTGYPGMQQIAIYAAAGILTSLLIARFILPYAIAGHARAMRAKFSFTRWLRFASARRLKLPVLALAAIALLAGLADMNWEDDISRLSPSLESLKAKDREIRSRMQSIEPGRFVLIDAGTPEAALQASEQATRVLEKLKRAGKLESYYSLYPWVASAALQQRNLQAFMQQMTPAALAAWRRALDAEGLNSSRLGHPAMPKEGLLTLADVAASPAGRYIAGQHVEAGRQAILTIWLGRHDEASLRTALAGMAHVSYVSQKALINDMNAVYRHKAIKALGYGSLVILLLLALRYRSLPMAAQALGPAMVSVAVVLGGWGLSGQPLGMLHLVGMLLAVAICVDYGIFFIENRAHDMRLTYEAIVASALTTMVAFSCLGLAENPALQILAWTVAPGVCLGFFLCPILIRSARTGLPRPAGGQ